MKKEHELECLMCFGTGEVESDVTNKLDVPTYLRRTSNCELCGGCGKDHSVLLNSLPKLLEVIEVQGEALKKIKAQPAGEGIADAYYRMLAVTNVAQDKVRGLLK